MSGISTFGDEFRGQYTQSLYLESAPRIPEVESIVFERTATRSDAGVREGREGRESISDSTLLEAPLKRDRHVR